MLTAKRCPFSANNRNRPCLRSRILRSISHQIMWLQTPPQRRSRLTETTYPRLSWLHVTESRSPRLSYSLLASQADRCPTFLAFMCSSFLIPHIPAVSTPSPDLHQAPFGQEKGARRTQGTRRTRGTRRDWCEVIRGGPVFGLQETKLPETKSLAETASGPDCSPTKPPSAPPAPCRLVVLCLLFSPAVAWDKEKGTYN